MTRSDTVLYVSGLFADHLMIFHLFITYWDIGSRIGQEYTEQNAFFLTSDILIFFPIDGRKIIEKFKKLKKYVKVYTI